MLKSIRLKNFKLHEGTKIDAAPITVFIGPNNSGKSSVFQALLALRQAAVRGNDIFLQSAERAQSSPEQPYLYPRGEIVDIGDFKDVVRHGHDELEIILSGDNAQDNAPSALPPMGVELHVLVRENSLAAHSGKLVSSDGELPWEWTRGRSQTMLGTVFVGQLAMSVSSNDNFKLISASFRAPQAASPQEISAATLNIRRLGEPVLTLLQSLRSILAIRGFEEWAYPTTNFPAGESLDRVVLSDRAVALPNALAGNARLRKEVSDRLNSLFDIGIDFENTSLRRVKVFATSGETGRPETLFVNEGTGANQLPFILVPIALAKPNDTILLSEPEAHLHPKAQCELTRMLLNVAKKENIQFFFETHSEHVLHAILNSVAKGEWNPKDIALYYFQNKNGTAEVTKREINEFGQVEGGLPDFFEQSLSELTDYLKALSKT